ncbi:MAG: RNA polymerase sigma factor RpoH [Alphaproteobacteria bacterium]|nr:RNA polymerase sigma factor RpoH [Alphaproteobacteria bacterium]
MTKQAVVKADTIALPAISASLSPEQGLRRYLQEIAKIPMLEPKEELELSRKWRDEGDVAAAHRLVTSHLRLVAKIAFKYRGYGLPVGELIAEGNIGMMQAIKRFDPEKGFRLSTYAIWWIKAAIQEYILRSWSMVKIGSSAAQKRLFFNLRKLKKKIGVGEHGERYMSDEQAGDIARILEVTPDDVKDMDQRMSGTDVYLNSAVGPDGEDEKMDFLVEPAQSHEIILADRQEMEGKNALLQTALANLSERERDIILRRRLKDEPDTLEDLSQSYGISRERIRQIEVRAFEKLQKEMLAAANA